MSARDWARFGLLHLRDGVWNGERVLPEGWVDFISTPAPANEAREYGGLFWLNAGGSMDRVPRDAYWPAGFMGQNTVIVPSRDLVVVRLGPSPGRGFDAYLNDLVGDVLDAIEPVDGPG
jgi:CubicO group peptidase (beta-lactamase class C family)